MLALTCSVCKALTPASQFQVAQGKCNSCHCECYKGWYNGKPSRKTGHNKRSALWYCLFVGMSLAQQAFFGCSRDELRAHFEGLFEPGMTWGSYGRACDGKVWQVDHIVPCSSFDLTDPLQLKECFSLSNIRPLRIQDNLKKGCRQMKRDVVILHPDQDNRDEDFHTTGAECAELPAPR